MNQSGACSLFFAKTNKKDACFGVPQSSSLPQSCTKKKGSGFEISFVLASITTDVILNVDLLHQSFRVVHSPLLGQLAPTGSSETFVPCFTERCCSFLQGP